MACKGSGVQIPSAPPGISHLPPPFSALSASNLPANDAQWPLQRIASPGLAVEGGLRRCEDDDQAFLDRIAEVQKRANSVFGVTSTPTFFVNGRRHVGAPSYPELVRLVEEAIDSR